MSRNRFVLALLALAVLSAPAAADEAMPETKAADTTAQPAQGPSPEEMAAWEKAMTPGDFHQKLEPTIGTWDVACKHWMEPGAPVSESKGRSTAKWIFGNRFVEQRFTGDMMGMPFEGLGYTGYDNVQGKYVGTWTDSMSTGIMTNTGTVDASGKVFTFKGSTWDPMTGKEIWMRMVTTVDGPDRHRFEMYCNDKAGKEFRCMELTYTRAGTAATN
jgi:hypothetical protein